MKIPEEILDIVINTSTENIKKYERKKVLEKGEVKKFVEELYRLEGKDIKEICWLNNQHEIANKIKTFEKPWVYHYSLHLNWVLFFMNLYEMTLHFSYFKPWDRDTNILEFLDEAKETYEKVRLLRWILENSDGIVETEDNIYIIESDLCLIKSGLSKLSFNERIDRIS